MSAIRELFGQQFPALIMFDLDGTLLDSVPDLAAAVNEMLHQLGREPVSLQQVSTWVGNGAMVLVQRALAKDMDFAHITEQQAQPALELFLQAYAQEDSRSQLYPEVLPTLQELRNLGARLAIITNKPKRFLPNLLAQFGMADLFDWVVGGDSLPNNKPAPDGLLWVMQQAEVTAAQSLFIGDSKNDINAAKAASVPCIAVSYGYNHGRPVAEHQPDLVIDAMSELL